MAIEINKELKKASEKNEVLQAALKREIKKSEELRLHLERLQKSGRK